MWYYCSEFVCPTWQYSDDKEDCFYEELEHVFNQFPTHHMKIVLGYFSENVQNADIWNARNKNYQQDKTVRHWQSHGVQRHEEN